MEEWVEARRYLSENGKRLEQAAAEQRGKESVGTGKVAPAAMEGRIAAVDSGFLAGRFHGVDWVLARGVAVAFEYGTGRLRKALYRPGRRPPAKAQVCLGLEEGEAGGFRQLVRLQLEVELARSAVEAWEPSLLMMDGSLLPLPTDRPPAEGDLAPAYAQLLQEYGKLQDAARSRKAQLVGVVKDSRSKRWMKRLGLGQATDTLFFGHYLRGGEYSQPIAYGEGKAAGIQVIYLKLTDDDLPLRVEYMGRAEDGARIAAMVAGVSPRNRAQAYPAPLIEADLRARMDPEEAKALEQALEGAAEPLRRNRRSF